MINLAKTILPGQTIGIIGGGQLGRMMALAAKEAGFRIAVLDPSTDSPCGQVADIEITASFSDRNALKQLADVSDVITYEFENIDYESLKWLQTISYVPQGAELIRITQHRIYEKEAIVKAGANVAPYQAIYTDADLELHISTLGFPAVLKTATGGYDGKGQVVIREESDVKRAMQLLEHGPCVLEKWVPFEKEISVIVTRSTNGETTVLPVAENIHVNNILHETIVPARISEHLQWQAIQEAKKIADYVQLVGTLAVEMFITSDSEVLINELAPRPHNSGHFSIEACATSQFAQHIRAICNWPLKDTTLLKPAVMVNVLGQHMEEAIQRIGRYPHWSFHLYGKKEAKTNRKMGHITVLTDDVDRTLEEINQSQIWMKERIGGKKA